MSTQHCSIRNLRCATTALFIAAGLEAFRQIAFIGLSAWQSHVPASLLFASLVFLLTFALLRNANFKSALLNPLESAEGILVTAATGDISMRKAAERHLAQTEARYRGLLEAAPDAMIVVNQSGEIILLNAQTERTFGYHRDELLGQKVKDIIPEGFAERLIADNLRTMADALAQQIGTGIELSARRKDGSEFPIEIMLSPLESAEGILVTAAIRDISVRKAAERHLAQTEARYRGLLEAAPDAMVISDGQGHIVLVNAETERMFGYSRGELVGKLVEILMPERFRGKHPQQRQGYTAHPHSRTINEGRELYGLRKNGTEFPAEIGLSPLETSEGLLVTAAIRDISMRKRAENALSESEERFRVQAEADLLLNQQLQFKDEFLSHVSHELRSPLTAIYQFATILLDRLAGDLNPEQLEFLEIVLRNVKQLQSMINDLLDVTRVQAGKLAIEPQCTSVSDAIAYVINTLQETATAKGIYLSSCIENELPSVCADPTRIRQILVILVDNAIKFTPANGTVKIQARKSEEAASLLVMEVADSGCGISPEMTARIFERLFQASDAALHGRKGLGLGLYICKELVTRQGGQIWAKSTRGEGAVFSLTLPVFSLSNLIAPAFKKKRPAETPVTLVVTEIGSLTGWLSNEARAEQSHEVRTLLQKCLHSDLDVLLPKMAFVGAVELFFIVAITDEIGGEAITKRIREQLEDSEHIQQAALTFSTTYRPLNAIRGNTSETVETFLESVTAKVQNAMNEEISLRMVKNG